MSKLNKIPKKSTWVDMTAFVDVAFLILSFFMLATKFKPPEVVKIDNPKSVSSENQPEKDVFKVSFDKEGRVFVSYSTDQDGKEKAKLTAEVLSRQKGLGLTPADIATFVKFSVGGIGVPVEKLKGFLQLSDEEYKSFKQPGIPVQDTLNNQLNDYLNALLTGTGGRKPENVMLNGDNGTTYPYFKNVLAAFKKNGIFSFKLITSLEGVPEGTPLYKTRKEQSKK
ncbi:MAG: biopolymer transporter ExbD [Chitinophagaceae bacterium]|jgi:biopolymer transport protein ExbD|nr:biopolymer transporter ExbD [Chitinophagaceae bacterium]